MAINLTDSLNAATTKGKLGDAKQVYLNGDTKNLQQTYEETSTHFDTLDNRSTQMERAIQDISATGGASTANAVSYNNSTSKLEAITTQGAIDELNTKKFDKESILQESGNAEDKVMSQKAVSDILGTFSCNSYCYFSGPAYPKVSVINDGNKISITFPSHCELRLYSSNGVKVIANITDGETYEISTPNKLVYDLANNSFKIVNFIDNLTQLLLIGTSGIPFNKDNQVFAVGLLAHYVNPYLIKIYNGSITTKNLADKVITPTKLADGSFQNDFIVIDKTDKFMSSDCVFGTIQGSGGISQSNSAFTTPYTRVLAGTKVIISAPKITDTDGNTYTPKFRVMLYLQKNDGFLTKLDYNAWSANTEYIIPNGVNNIRVSALYFKDADGTSNSDIREFCNNAYISIDRDLNNVVDTNNFTPALFDKNMQSLARIEVDKVENVISQETGSNKKLVMSQKAVSDKLSELTSAIKTFSCNSYCYFSGPAYPTVSVINDGNKISITFPSHCELRLYYNNGTLVLKKLVDRETYEIPTPNKLVYNIETRDIEIVTEIKDLKHLLLIGNCGIPFGYTSVFAVGLLAQYVNPYLSYLKDIKDDIASLKNNVAIFDNVPNFYSRLISYRNNVKKGSDFSFLFFTDIHGLEKEAKRLFSLANTYGSAYIDAIINAGDTVASTINEELDWYNNIVKESSIPTLTTAGNHDCWLNYSPQTFAEPTQTYNKIMSTVTEQANVVLPDNAAINGYNYYYKDFGNIRIIVLDSTYAYHSSSYREAEIKWFKEVALADTSKNVLCVIHHPFTDTTNAKNGIITWYEDSNFNTKVPVGDGAVANVDFVNAIDEFIGNGGTFIAWLCGHTHSDEIGIMKEHNNQLVIVNNTARGQNVFPFNVDTDRNENTSNFDCFDYIGIDTTNGIIKRLRYGVISDIFMRKKEMMCYDYKNHKFIN